MIEDEDLETTETTNVANSININILWLPIAVSIICLALMVIILAFFISQNLYNPDLLPTLSELARKYPQNKIFAIGFSVEGILIFILSYFIISSLKIHGITWAPFLYIPSSLSSISFICMSSCGLNDNIFVHGLFLVMSFIFILFFMILVHIGIMKAQLTRFHRFKFLLILFATLTVIALSVITPLEESYVTTCIKAISQYLLIFCVFLYIGLWIVDLQEIEITFEIAD